MWTKSQLASLVEAGYKKFGAKVEEWSHDAFDKLGKLIGGLPSSELAKIPVEAFDKK